MAQVRDASAAGTAVREASALVSQAIARLAALGADAPVSVRYALSELGEAYTALGWTDPSIPHSVAEAAEEARTA